MGKRVQGPSWRADGLRARSKDGQSGARRVVLSSGRNASLGGDALSGGEWVRAILKRVIEVLKEIKSEFEAIKIRKRI